MGAVYDVYIKLEYEDEMVVVDVLNDYIDENHGHGIVFDLDRYENEGIGRDTLDDLIQYFITDQGFEILGLGEYESSFTASYGWESVLISMFERIAPLLYDGSRIEIYPDSGTEIGVVENGKVDWM